MNNNQIKTLPYTAISISIVARFIFMFLIYKNKSTNNFSLIFCVLNIFSSSMWIYYSVLNNDMPMVIRSSTELSLLTISALYIVRNKYLTYQIENRTLPI
jgi:uncharacterized protein with PQ loop repeat